MPTFVILLRAVNVGGFGKLSMADFREILSGLGFKNVQTYIQSGNAVIDSDGSDASVTTSVTKTLQKRLGAPVDVIVRTHNQLDSLIKNNPFPSYSVDGTRVHVAGL